MVAWGSDSSGQTNVPVVLGNVLAVAAGASHSLALLEVRPGMSAAIPTPGSVCVFWPRSASGWGVESSPSMAAGS